MQFRSRPFWMRCPKHFREISWGTSVPSYCHLWQVRRWTPAGALPVPFFHETSNLAWRQKILRKTGKKPSCFFFLATYQALTKIEDETNVPVPLLDLQKLLDPERRCESLAVAVDYKDTIKKIQTNFWTQRKTTIASISRLFGSRWLCHKQHLHMK